MSIAGKGVKMKFIISLTIILASFNTMACPDLNGTFNKCTTGDRIQDVAMGINKAKLNVVQNGKSIEVDFLGKKTTLKVDETITIENYSQEQRATFYSTVSSFCQSDILNIEEESKIVFDNGKVEFETSKTEAYLRANKINLDIEQTRNGRVTKLNIKCRKI